MGNINLLTIFLTGLLTGGLTCMAVQGGLLAATLAQRQEIKLEEKAKRGNTLPILSFLIAKLTAYTILGLFLGLLGSFFQLSTNLSVILQIAIAIFMIGTALNILNVHPIFRYFIIQPPKFLTRFIRKESKSKEVFAPVILGAFTIFIPCGTTQAMMALAVGSANPLVGATILFAFILGTSPVFFVLGYFATKLGDIFQQGFMRIAAITIILLALFNVNNALALTGSNFSILNTTKNIYCTFSFCSDTTSVQGPSKPVSDALINIESTGYTPNNLTVKAGSKVTIKLHNIDGNSCVQAFTIPSLNIQKIIPVGNSDTISFIAPKTPGELSFMCSMGMYRGVINVI